MQKPEQDEWGTGLEAMKTALDLEKHVNQSLLDLHKVADKNGDPQVRISQIPFVAMVVSLVSIVTCTWWGREREEVVFMSILVS